MSSHYDMPTLRPSKKYWFQDAGLAKLYFLILVAILSSATNGYDGFVLVPVVKTALTVPS